MSLPTELFNGLHSLYDLDLSGNSLVSLPTELFNGLHNLYDLDLSGNSLVSLPTELFNGLHSLYDLDLSGNSLVSLPTELFNGLHSLYDTDLSGNSLESLPTEFINGLHSLYQALKHPGPSESDVYSDVIQEAQSNDLLHTARLLMRLDTPLHDNARGTKYAVYYASVVTHSVRK